MTTMLRKPYPRAKEATTPDDVECALAREVKGQALCFLQRPPGQQLAPILRLRLPFTCQELWQMRETFPRDFHTRDLLASAERLAQQLYGAKRRKG